MRMKPKSERDGSSSVGEKVANDVNAMVLYVSISLILFDMLTWTWMNLCFEYTRFFSLGSCVDIDLSCILAKEQRQRPYILNSGGAKEHSLLYTQRKVFRIEKVHIFIKFVFKMWNISSSSSSWRVFFLVLLLLRIRLYWPMMIFGFVFLLLPIDFKDGRVQSIFIVFDGKALILRQALPPAVLLHQSLSKLKAQAMLVHSFSLLLYVYTKCLCANWIWRCFCSHVIFDDTIFIQFSCLFSPLFHCLPITEHSPRCVCLCIEIETHRDGVSIPINGESMAEKSTDWNCVV